MNEDCNVCIQIKHVLFLNVILCSVSLDKHLMSLSCLYQHRGRVRAYGRRRGHIQGVSHPSQEPEDPGRGCGDHPPEPGNQARDLVGSGYQLLDQLSRSRSEQRRSV